MTSSPRVTVLMGVHNADAMLPTAIDSALAQTFADLELLIVDDGSTDPTPERLRAHCDPRIRVVRQERAGLTEALARGVMLARGSYVARLDADDVAHPERLERQVGLLDADPALALVGSWAEIVDERGRRLETARPPADDDAIRAQLLWDNAFFHSAMTFRRSAALAAGSYDVAVARAQDYDLAWRIGRVGRLANVPETLLRWRRAPQAISVVHRDEQRRSAARTAYRALAAHLGTPPPEDRFARLRDLWDGRSDRLVAGDGLWLAGLLERLPRAAGRTVWVDLVVAVAAALRREAPRLLATAWRCLPEARLRLLAPDRVARLAAGPSGLAAARAVRRRVRGY